jgi:uncharacterized membrane protein YecN with MAPEG domain
MQPPAVTAIYAGLSGVMLVVLAVRVIRMRRQARAAFGDGGDLRLAARIRAHGNFAEYVPIALLLLTISELLGWPASVLHGIGMTLLAGRIVHASALAAGSIRARVVGMSLTFAAIAAGAACCLVAASGAGP